MTFFAVFRRFFCFPAVFGLQASAKIAKLLGISGRALTAAEKRLFDKWKDLDLSLIAEAYERSVQNTGKYAYNYSLASVIFNKKEGGFGRKADPVGKRKNQ